MKPVGNGKLVTSQIIMKSSIRLQMPSSLITRNTPYRREYCAVLLFWIFTLLKCQCLFSPCWWSVSFYLYYFPSLRGIFTSGTFSSLDSNHNCGRHTPLYTSFYSIGWSDFFLANVYRNNSEMCIDKIMLVIRIVKVVQVLKYNGGI